MVLEMLKALAFSIFYLNLYYKKLQAKTKYYLSYPEVICDRNQKNEI